MMKRNLSVREGKFGAPPFQFPFLVIQSRGSQLVKLMDVFNFLRKDNRNRKLQAWGGGVRPIIEDCIQAKNS